MNEPHTRRGKPRPLAIGVLGALLYLVAIAALLLAISASTYAIVWLLRHAL
jgi:hypothetical protein